ncbi:ATP cone domain-containing protein [Candidatus Nanohalococcus occultus]|uniref:ATP-cone domain-containing protein n=1 Tax=Candidatus Nanohalococcus occultus TaxID=2978047 RepID=A0ABY8CD34_9ARCH|nr:hypothetical protein SVXNc_0060 [Candidatus Nanohaloarchaeota archaeon SVXNc]
MKVINRDHEKEEFEDEKLYCSVYYPAREVEIPEERADALAEKVIYEVKAWIHDHEDDVVTTSEIESKIESILGRLNDDVCIMYRTHLDLN